MGKTFKDNKNNKYKQIKNKSNNKKDSEIRKIEKYFGNNGIRNNLTFFSYNDD
jgi:hypothetical protein